MGKSVALMVCREEMQAKLAFAADEPAVLAVAREFLFLCVEATSSNGHVQDDWERECFAAAAVAVNASMGVLAVRFLDQGLTPADQRDRHARAAVCQVSIHDLTLMHAAATESHTVFNFAKPNGP